MGIRAPPYPLTPLPPSGTTLKAVNFTAVGGAEDICSYGQGNRKINNKNKICKRDPSWVLSF